MGQVSRALKTYLANPHTMPEARVKVVVAMKTPPVATISMVASGAKPRARAMDVLKDCGLSGPAMKSESFHPKHILAGNHAVSAEVAASDVEKLAASPGVAYVRAMRIHKMHLDVSVPLLGVDASVTKAQDGKGILVAVIDSGIDSKHPDLKGRVRLDLSRNFTTEGGPKDVTDGNGHGTHVAGIIGGAGKKFRGVAPGVEIMSCKVFDTQGQAGEEGAISAAVRWAVEKGADVINYSGGYSPVQHGVALVDPPWVWPIDLIEEEVEFQAAMDAGTTCVVSAGNDGDLGVRSTLSMPATCPAVISVGALDKNRILTSFSSIGPALRSAKVSPADVPATYTPELKPFVKSFAEVDLVTPGGGVNHAAASAGACFYTGGIISLLADGAAEMEKVCFIGEHYVRLSGTSQAAPHVSGLAALVLAAAKKGGIDLGAKRSYVVKGILRAACTKLTGLTKYQQGKGLPAWSAIEGVLADLKSGKTMLAKLAKS